MSLLVEPDVCCGGPGPSLFSDSDPWLHLIDLIFYPTVLSDYLSHPLAFNSMGAKLQTIQAA